jgi:hypothetical protein
MKRKSLTFEEHKKLGATISWMRENFATARILISKGLGSSSNLSKQAQRILDSLDELRDGLEEVVYRDFPQRDREEKLSCYYPTRKDYEVLVGPSGRTMA